MTTVQKKYPFSRTTGFSKYFWKIAGRFDKKASSNDGKKTSAEFSLEAVEPYEKYGSSMDDTIQSSITSYSLWDPENEGKHSSRGTCTKDRICNAVLISTTVIVIAVIALAFIVTQLGGINGIGNHSDELHGHYEVFRVSFRAAHQQVLDEAANEYYRSTVDTIYKQSDLGETFSRTSIENNDDPAVLNLMVHFEKNKTNTTMRSVENLRDILIEGLKAMGSGTVDLNSTEIKQIADNELRSSRNLHRVTRGSLKNGDKQTTPRIGDYLKLHGNKSVTKFTNNFRNRTKPQRKNSPIYTFKLNHGENLRDALGKLLADLSLGKNPSDLKLNLDSATESSNKVKPWTINSLEHQNRLKSGANSGDEIAITEFSNDIFEQVDKVTNDTVIKTASSNTSSLLTCDEEKSFRCRSGECVSPLSRCNLMQDCSDNSDELDCKCADFFRAKFLGRKICDGIVDCWDFSDENECEWCSPEKYICSNSKTCIDQHKICDGSKDCPSGDDEKYCITISQDDKVLDNNIYVNSGFVMVRRHGHWGRLCSQNFDSVVKKMPVAFGLAELGNAVCSAATYNHLDRIDRRVDPHLQNRSLDNFPFYEITEAAADHDPENTTLDQSSSSSFIEFKNTKCSRREVVHVTCHGLACGVRPKLSPVRARIVGGGNAAPGAWPWQAALYKEGDFQCGATLINDRWLISAGHCFYHALDDHWVARLGALRRGSNLMSPYEQIRVVCSLRGTVPGKRKRS